MLVYSNRFQAMFAVVRTGGKQYRVAAEQKIIVERLPGEAGDTVTLGDVLLIGEGADVSAGGGKTVTAEIVAQTKADKVIVFKKKRRHNYRRKNGHRQLQTVLKIVAIDGQRAAAPAQAARTTTEADMAPAVETAVEATAIEAATGTAAIEATTTSVAADAAPAAEKPKRAKKAAPAADGATE